MKSSYSVAVLLAIAFVLSGFTWNSAKSTTKTNLPVKDSSPIPAEIFKVMENSCLACHGENGKAMALSHLKLSEWDGYSSEKQVQKAEAICKKVSGGSMPPKGYIKNNPGAALTKEQIESICNWSKSLK